MKSKTHIFMANLLIEDLKGETLTLPGVGKFTPATEVKNAILHFPSAFRAGAVGPDFYPDMLFGQAVIHPEQSGKWLDLMFKRLSYSIPAEYEKNFSFALGFMFHYAGDMFGHTYVNAYAGGWFPPYEEIVKDTEKAKIVARHLLVESYMDSKVPLGSDMSLAPPIDFIRDTFYCNDAIKLDPDSIIKPTPDSMINLPRKFTILRKDVHNTLNDALVGQMPLVTDYVQHWEKDIDNGIMSWLEVWAQTAKIFCNNNPGKIELSQGYLENWIIRNLTSMVGIPDFVGKFIEFMNELDILKPMKDYLKNYFKDFMIAIVKAITGKCYTNIEEVITETQRIFKDPKTYLDNGVLFSETNVSAKLDLDFGNYGIECDTTKQSFHAVYQCINMGKLHLLSAEDLNKIISISATASKYAGSSTIPAAKIRFLTVKTGSSRGAGTNNNIYIGIQYNGIIYEVLCDIPGYDDFEYNHEDTYDFTIPENIDLSKIDKITARMSGDTWFGDWECDWIRIKDHSGSILLETTNGFWLSSGHTQLCDFSRKYNIPLRNIPIDSKILSFLHSLDGKGTDNSNPAKEKQWEIGFQFYKDQILREKIFKPLFETKAEPGPNISTISRIDFHIGDIIDSVTFKYTDGHLDKFGGDGGGKHEYCEIASYEKIVGISFTNFRFDECDTISQITVKLSSGREQRFSGGRFVDNNQGKQSIEIKAPAGQYIYSFYGKQDHSFLNSLKIRETKSL